MSETLNGVDSMSAELNDSQDVPLTPESESQMETVVDHGEQEYKDQTGSEASQNTKTTRKRSKGAKSQTPLKKVIVCFDVGSSLNKILYQVEGHDVQYMVMEPEHLTLPPQSAASLPTDSGMGRPEDNAWIRFKKGEECHAVGRVANDFNAFVNFKTLKWEIATPKILGALGAIAEQCLSWARAIQQYASLDLDSGVLEMNMPKLKDSSSHNVQLRSIEMTTTNSEVDSDDEFMLSEEEKRRSSGEDLMSSMGL